MSLQTMQILNMMLNTQNLLNPGPSFGTHIHRLINVVGRLDIIEIMSCLSRQSSGKGYFWKEGLMLPNTGVG